MNGDAGGASESRGARRPGSARVAKYIDDHISFRRPSDAPEWVKAPELPSPAELLSPHAVTPPVNNLRRPWNDKAAYLAAQYQILRVEATETLRYAVNCVRLNPGMMDDHETCIYTNVRVQGYLMCRLGPACRISFSTERAGRKIMWQQTKRLTPGGLVALTPASDGFSSICRVGVVAQRPYSGGLDKNPPEVDIFWADIDAAAVDPGEEMIMIESRVGYFEASRHVLVGLQHAFKTSSPLDDYLVFLNRKDQPAGFIKDHPIMDLSALVNNTPCSDGGDAPRENKAIKAAAAAREALRSCDVLSTLPSLHGVTTLDASQLEAVRRMVTKEFAIIQGPPGTGKTFTSVAALKIMLANRKPMDPPVVIAAQTNQSLDQLLALCQDAGARIMRVGGRTENEDIKNRTVYSLARQGRFLANGKFRSLESGRRKNIDDLASLAGLVFPDGLLDPELLLHVGILSEAQFKSLVDNDWGRNMEHGAENPFETWLGKEKVPAIVEKMHYTHYDYEEAEEDVPEYELDADLDNIADTVEEDRIDGTFIPFTHKWTGARPRSRRGVAQASEALDTQKDLYLVPQHLRGGVYQLIQGRLLKAKLASFYPLLRDAVQRARETKANKWLKDSNLIHEHSIDIIGCTTTGLTKYRGFIAAAEPRTLLVEEAAQTREANIASALYPTLRQLILVGDHQQLTPRCDVRVLGDEPWYLDVSLFERLVNYLPFTRLNRQRRMAPELRTILNTFYPDLEDHPSVLARRPPVAGVGDRHSFFFHHTWPEESGDDHSKVNRPEAEMVVKFVAYLVKNGVDVSTITILTYYNGQRKLLLKLLHKDPLVGATAFFNVFTVDSYQGEENDVVILSLVRSPKPHHPYAVGFLESKNRATVAISRARRGLYVFGNKDNLLCASQYSFQVWCRVWNGFSDQDRVAPGRGLPLVCQNHGDETWFQTAEDFVGNSGGCQRDCEATRPCGHACKLKCHVIEHARLPCLQACSKTLHCGHKCTRSCSEACFCPCSRFILGGAETPHRTFLSAPTTGEGGTASTRNVRARSSKGDGYGNGSGSGSSHRYDANSASCRNNATPDRDALATPELWHSFSQNAGKHDEDLRRERSSQPSSGRAIAIHETYRRTALVDGQRTRVAAPQGGSRVDVHGFDMEVLQPAGTGRTAGPTPPTQGQVSGPSPTRRGDEQDWLIDL